jgi:hypothetical protein
LAAVWRQVACNKGGGVPRHESVCDSRVLHFTAESVSADSHRKTSAVRLSHDPKAGTNISSGVKILVHGQAYVCACLSVEPSGWTCPWKSRSKLTAVGTNFTWRGGQRLRRPPISVARPRPASNTTWNAAHACGRAQ